MGKRIGALEAGGTKMVLAVGTEDGQILERESLPTTAPEQVVPQMAAWFAEREVDAVGIGAFGPTAVDPASRSTAMCSTRPSRAGAATTS